MRSHLRLASAVGAATLSVIAVAPAMAAAPVSQAGANAVNLSIAGNANGSGHATAKNDGTTETKSGQETPPVSVLGGQQLLSLGVLAQEATAAIDGTSAACAGVAGSGGSVVNVGGSRCLTGGTPVGLSLGNLDLSDTFVIDPASALGPLAEANAPLQLILGSISGPLADAIADTPLAGSGLTGGFGVVEGRCTAELGSATGDARLVDSRLTLNVAGQEVVLTNFDPDPPANTEFTVDLEKATQAILDAVSTQLETMLAAPGGPPGPLAPLATLSTALQDQVIATLVAAIKPQLLEPLSENVISGVLNRQIRTGDDAIKVRALELTLLPVARAQLGEDLLNLQIGNAACGPSGRIAGAVAGPLPAEPTALPTAVSAGYATAPGGSSQGDDSTNAIVLGAFALLVASGAGFVTFRRLRA